MKVMLLTGYIDYESFDDPANYNNTQNPLSDNKAKIFDISTVDKHKKALQTVLKECVKDNYGDVEYFVFEEFENNTEPEEPTVKLSSLKDEDLLHKVEEDYKKLVKQYKEKKVIAQKIKDFFNADEKQLKAFDMDWVEDFADTWLAIMFKNQVPRIYIHELA